VKELEKEERPCDIKHPQTEGKCKERSQRKKNKEFRLSTWVFMLGKKEQTAGGEEVGRSFRWEQKRLERIVFRREGPERSYLSAWWVSKKENP